VKYPALGDIIGSNLNVANGGTDEQTIIDSRTINRIKKSPAAFCRLAK
jgi:hypothetical protein